MRNPLTTCALLAVLAGASLGQSDLTVAVTGDLANGGSVTWSVTGAPANAATAVLASPSDTGFSIGPILTLGIGPVVVPVAIGQTDVNGDFSTTFNFSALPPAVVANLAPIDFYSQAVSLASGPPMFGFVVSDVEMATVN